MKTYKALTKAQSKALEVLTHNAGPIRVSNSTRVYSGGDAQVSKAAIQRFVDEGLVELREQFGGTYTAHLTDKALNGEGEWVI